MSVLEFDAIGVPAPQGSKRIGRNRRGQPIILDDNDVAKTRWRMQVHAAASLALRDAGIDTAPAGVPVLVSIVFRFARPIGHSGTGRNAGVLKSWAPTLVTTKPDVDKLTRAVLDSLTTAGVMADDNQAQLGRCLKRYCDPGDPPSATILVETMCRTCACTDLAACPLGCSWVEPGLCSSCVAA